MRSASGGRSVATEVLLLRHASTSWNDEDRRQGWADPPLTAAGRELAGAWAAGVTTDFAGVYSSDLQRAGETAAIIALALDLVAVRTVAGLREQDQGAWTGLTKPEIKRRWPDRLRERPRRPVDGETAEQVVRRAVTAIVHLAGVHAGHRVLVVTHNGVICNLERAISTESPQVPHLEGRWIRVLAAGPPALELGSLTRAVVDVESSSQTASPWRWA